MRTICLSVIAVVLLLFAVPAEPSSTQMYVSTADGLVQYTDFNLGTKTVIGTNPGGANRGLDVDSQGNVYVAYTNGTIYKYDRNPDGSLNSNYYTYATGLGMTHGIGIDSSDNLYATDYSSGKVYILGSSWTAGSAANASTPHLTATGGAHGVSFDSNGYIYVSIFGGSVLKYNSAGAQLGTYASIHSSTTVVGENILYTVADNVYTMPLFTDDTVPNYNTGSPQVSHLISGISGSVTDFVIDGDSNMYLSSYYGGNIYKYDQYGNPVGGGIFDSSIANPHFMASWQAPESEPEPVIPEPASLILLAFSVSALLKKRLK